MLRDKILSVCACSHVRACVCVCWRVCVCAYGTKCFQNLISNVYDEVKCWDMVPKNTEQTNQHCYFLHTGRIICNLCFLLRLALLYYCISARIHPLIKDSSSRTLRLNLPHHFHPYINSGHWVLDTHEMGRFSKVPFSLTKFRCLTVKINSH